MAGRCGGGGLCPCKVVGNLGIAVSGSGSTTDPYGVAISPVTAAPAIINAVRDDIVQSGATDYLCYGDRVSSGVRQYSSSPIQFPAGFMAFYGGKKGPNIVHPSATRELRYFLTTGQTGGQLHAAVYWGTEAQYSALPQRALFSPAAAGPGEHTLTFGPMDIPAAVTWIYVMFRVSGSPSVLPQFTGSPAIVGGEDFLNPHPGNNYTGIKTGSSFPATLNPGDVTYTATDRKIWWAIA